MSALAGRTTPFSTAYSLEMHSVWLPIKKQWTKLTFGSEVEDCLSVLVRQSEALAGINRREGSTVTFEL